MNLLVLGYSAKPGSWTIRGQQLGAALGARVTSTPTPDDWKWAELAVVVKRCEPHYGPAARAAGVPIVWDALDCWRQPGENGLGESLARQTLHAHVRAIRPALSIGATQAQAEALKGVYLPHHSRPGLTPAPARERVEVVAYEGNAAYLGRWLEWVSTACTRRGWRFVVNPPDLRDGPWDGWMCRQWKSGVKLVNAIAAGRPVITQHTAAWQEIGPPGSAVWEASDLEPVLDWWASLAARVDAANTCRELATRYALETVADQYRLILNEVHSRCAA